MSSPRKRGTYDSNHREPARKRLFPLIQAVNENHTPVEIVSKHGNAVLVAKEDWPRDTTTSGKDGQKRFLGRGGSPGVLRGVRYEWWHSDAGGSGRCDARQS